MTEEDSYRYVFLYTGFAIEFTTASDMSVDMQQLYKIKFFINSIVGKVLVFSLLLLSLQLTCAAQNITRPNIEGPSGLQVNSYTGSLFYQRTDLNIPGRGLSLEILFTYNSAEQDRDWGFGYGWNLNYNQQYRTDSAGVVMNKADGREDLFLKKNNAYVAPKGVFDQLVEVETGKFKLTTKDGTEYYFENPEHKKLTRIRERNGNEILLNYTGSNLTTLTDAAGRTLSLTWSDNRLSQITDANSSTRTVSFEYNGTGCMVGVENPVGDKTTYTYGSKRRLSGLTDGNGNAVNITYSTNGAVTRLVSCQTDQSISYNTEQAKTYIIEKSTDKQLITSYSFDEEGRLVERSGNCCGYKNTFEYDAANNISKITNANGAATIYSYDSRGNVIAETDPLGKSIRYTYEKAFNQVTSVTDKNGNLTAFTYDAKGNLTGVTHPLNITETYTYDSNGDRTSYTNGRGEKTTYTYDKYGNLTTITDPAGGANTFTFDPQGNVLTWVNPNKSKTEYTYDALNRIVTVNDALGGTTKYTYDANSNPLSATDANGNTTSYTYDALDNLIMMKDAMGKSTAMVYSPFGTLTSQTDAVGNTSRFEYDEMNRLVSETNAAYEKTTFTRDGYGNITSITYPNGNTVNLRYDALNRVTSITDGLGSLAAYTYDANSNKISETDGMGNTSTFKYDVLNRLISQNDPLGNAYTYSYDANGNITKEINRNGQSTTYTYDAADRQLTTNDALGNVTSFTYDKAGNLLTVKDANNNVTAYTYDALDRLTQERFADNTTKTYKYDGVGNLISRTDNIGQVTKYTYDKLYRPVSRAYPDATDAFSYDAVGRLLSAKNDHATVTFTYDAVGRVLSETLNEKTTSYTYDVASGKKTIKYPGGRVIERTTDERAQLKKIRDEMQVLAEFSYNTAGLLTGRRYANNTALNQEFNGNSRVTSLSHSPSRFVDLGYNYDKEDNPVAAQFRHRTNYSEQYGYDKLNQLKEYRKGSTQQVQFNYDGVGNRTTANIDGIMATYAVTNMNAYSSILFGESQNLALTYDSNGNLIGDGKSAYSYDYENRITAVDNGTTARYTYDALGRRIQKIAGDLTINYYYDGLQLIEERNELDAVEATYVYGTWLDDIISMTRDGKSYYYHHNAIGSVVAITNNTGAVVEQYGYDAFGNLAIYDNTFSELAASAIGNTFTFTGRQFDSETDLYYYRARYYDPVQGRFLQRDPLGYIDGFNSYAFVANNPILKIDPLGLSWWDGIDRFVAEVEIPYLNEISDFSAGFGDALTFGLTSKIRDLTGANSVVNKSSCAYAVGEWTSIGVSIFITMPQGLTRGGTQVVSHWAPKGVKALRSGDWVMTGGVNWVNYIKAGGIPKLSGRVKLPGILQHEFKNAFPQIVKKSDLYWPKGWEWWKGFLGQRRYYPK